MHKVLVIGHSHMNALTGAPDIVGERGSTFHFISFGAIKPGLYAETDPAAFAGQAAEAHDAVVFMLHGSQHIALGLVNPPGRPFDFTLPDEPALPLNPAAQWLPVDLVERMLTRVVASELRYAATLYQTFNGHRRLRIESPPPLPSAFVAQNPHSFADKIQEQGISPEPFRYKLWRLYSRIVREHALQHGVQFVGVPPATQDEHGMLAQPFWRNDPSHANGQYGNLVAQQIRALASQQAVLA